jgi:PTS system fructose-specific IIC component
MIVTLFEVSVPAPHGGLFVLALMTHWWGFVIAIISGMFLATLMMKVMKIIGDQTHETT